MIIPFLLLEIIALNIGVLKVGAVTRKTILRLIARYIVVRMLGAIMPKMELVVIV